MRKFVDVLFLVSALIVVGARGEVLFEDEFDGAVHGYDADYAGAEGDSDWCDFKNRGASDQLATTPTGETVLQLAENGADLGRIQVRSAFDLSLDVSQIHRITLRLRMGKEGG